MYVGMASITKVLLEMIMPVLQVKGLTEFGFQEEGHFPCEIAGSLLTWFTYVQPAS